MPPAGSLVHCLYILEFINGNSWAMHFHFSDVHSWWARLCVRNCIIYIFWFWPVNKYKRNHEENPTHPPTGVSVPTTLFLLRVSLSQRPPVIQPSRCSETSRWSLGGCLLTRCLGVSSFPMAHWVTGKYAVRGVQAEGAASNSNPARHIPTGNEGPNCSLKGARVEYSGPKSHVTPPQEREKQNIQFTPWHMCLKIYILLAFKAATILFSPQIKFELVEVEAVESFPMRSLIKF